MATGELSPADWVKLYSLAGDVFTPSAPIDRQDLFAGRIPQLAAILEAVHSKGQHAIVFGERGVGKTSLVSMLGHVRDLRFDGMVPVSRVNCTGEDTFGELWRRALVVPGGSIKRQSIGFASETTHVELRLAQALPDKASPGDVIDLLRKITVPIAFVFDEFDRAPTNVSKAFADTIKALSDHAALPTIVLVGVGENVQALLAAHASVDRALVQIRMPRMEPDELRKIIENAQKKIEIAFDKQASHRVVRLSQGLPHYVHLLGLCSAREAINHESRAVSVEHVVAGMKVAVSKAPQTTMHAYSQAVDSARSDARFRQVLLACALARTDDRNSFSAADVRTALHAIGQKMDIPAFASHLNKFTAKDRGNVLEKLGASRRFRYRFRNPLMQPYVLLRGLADGLVSQEIFERALPSREPPGARL